MKTKTQKLDLWNVLNEHGSLALVSTTHARKLAELIRQHDAECGRSGPINTGAATYLELHILALAISLGCKDVRFSCVDSCYARLIFEDGFSNAPAGGFRI